jgi:hypothetical protein
LKGKIILLEIKHVELSYDDPLESRIEMHITAKERQVFEIISIPIVQPIQKLMYWIYLGGFQRKFLSW